MPGANYLIAGLMMAVASPAVAQGPFNVRAVDNATLDETRGGFNASAFSLSVRQLRVIQDDAARNDFRFAGSVVGMSMDTWWASSGADLIAANATIQTD